MQTYTTPTGNGPTSPEGGSSAEQAKEKAKEQAQQAAGQAKSTMRTQVDQRSTQAGERVSTVASDARSIGQQLREQGKEQPAKMAEQAADRAEQLGNYLKQSDADRILGDIEDFGRRQPWAVIGGGLALGLVASRFLKASSTRRYEQRYQPRAELPARTPTVQSRPTVPATPPADVTLTGDVPAGTPGATAPGGSSYERGI